MREGTDEYWVGRATHDPDAFGELVERYQTRIFTLAYRLVGNREDAADLTQEAFLRAYRSLGTFRLDARFSPWMYKIAVNTCLNHRKIRSTHPEAELDESLVSHEISPERASEASELRDTLVAAIRGLPANYRAAIILRHVHDLAYEDIAEALDVPLGTVKTWIFRARERLQTQLAPARTG